MGKRKVEEAAGGEGEGGDAVDDRDRKVYVSRIPLTYDEAALIALFEKKLKCKVAGAEIKRDLEYNTSKGFGFITFFDPTDKEKAIAKGTIHKDQKNIKIMELIDESLVLGRGRDVGVCYNWSNFKCVKGDSCRFLHEGPGACVNVKPPGEGVSKKRCLSFKTKQKCSNPNCKFLHEKRNGDEGEEASQMGERPKICYKFKSKGKCRKGDSCPFEHIVT